MVIAGGKLSIKASYILKRGGNGAGASELPHIVRELNAP